jgi:RimJ/RimL family protein N-acetyltransferase
MILNEDVVLESMSGRIRLVPYRSEHVPQYHKWMCSPELLRLTESEPLSLSQEYESMQAWRDDPAKLTFIAIDCRSGCMFGDVNVVTNVDSDRPGLAEVDVMVAEIANRRCGMGMEALLMAMAYAVEQLHVEAFVAKILEENTASLALFSKLGFLLSKRVPVFQELHYELVVSEKVRKDLGVVRDGWTQASYAHLMSKNLGTR